MTIKKYLTQKEVARYLRVSIATLTAHRQNGTGISFIKLGRLVRYDIKDVKDWKDENSKKRWHKENNQL